MKKKQTVYWLIAIIVVLVIIAIVTTNPKTETLPSEETGEVVLEEGVVLEKPMTEEEKQSRIEELDDLKIPTIGEISPEEGVGVPGKVVDGEKEGQEYYVFEAELKDGILNPREFRIKQGNLLGISIINAEKETHIVHISTKSAFTPNFIEREIVSDTSGFMRTQVLESGVYDIICTTCKNEVIGQFIVVPKGEQ